MTAMIPGYHDQPATLDVRVEIPDDAPQAMGHLSRPERELAEAVKDANEDLKQAVDAERRAAEDARAAGEPEPGAPGDPTQGDESQGDEDRSDPEAVPDGSIDDVLDWVGEDSNRAQRALDAENCKSTPRSSLISKLESIAG